jgi:hypothetical protein
MSAIAKEVIVVDNVLWAALLSLVMGVLILVFPRILNYLVAAYLIIIGILGLLPYITGNA